MLRLYNTRTRAKEDFHPAEPGRITVYVCGPTVYNRAHIGNARPAVVFDVLARLLRHLYPGHRLDYARNITDIDDKIMAAAAAEGVGVEAIARRYEAAYVEDMAALGVEPPAIAPRATGHVAEMIALAQALEARGVAYAAEGHLLFATARDPAYGSLSGRDAEAMAAGARVEVAPYKRDPADFVLWKPSTGDQPGWDSPWGFGRPGWHLECSAMIGRHLGPTIDIHGGGQDLIFPHHENEAAQSRCSNDGAELARIWMHNGFLRMGADKMSKSLGNVVTPRELLDAGWDGEVIRLALLSAHYRQPLEWTDTLLEQSRARLDRWYRVLGGYPAAGEPSAHERELAGFFGDSTGPRGLADDLDIPGALAMVDTTIGWWASRTGVDRDRNLAAAAHHLRLLGLLGRPAEAWFKGGTADADAEAIGSRIEARRAAKAARDFASADRIRAELLGEGIVLEDRPDGSTDWRRA